jgi:hypothetical protein
MPPVTPQVYQTLGPSLRGGLALNNDIANSLRNYSDTITALAGGGATGAVLLALGINKVTTVGSAADSVMLPKSTPGAVVIVTNTTATAMQVFANTTSSLPSAVLDTINGTAGATGVSVAAGKTAIFMCSAYGAWFGPVALA